jgi:hypothetical protein
VVKDRLIVAEVERIWLLAKVVLAPDEDALDDVVLADPDIVEPSDLGSVRRHHPATLQRRRSPDRQTQEGQNSSHR